MFKRLFHDHPASLGETYPQHLREASHFGLRMLGGGVACILHALVPALFEKTGSDTVAALHTDLVRKRAARRAAAEEMRTGGWVI